MKLQELTEMLSKDFVWDKYEIAEESAKTSKLFTKYIVLWSEENLILKRLRSKLNKVIQEKRDYYSGNGTPEQYKAKPFGLKIKSESGIQKYIESDDDVILVHDQIAIQEQKVEILEACLNEINRRGYALKTALEEHKFKSGA